MGGEEGGLGEGQSLHIHTQKKEKKINRTNNGKRYTRDQR